MCNFLEPKQVASCINRRLQTDGIKVDFSVQKVDRGGLVQGRGLKGLGRGGTSEGHEPGAPCGH